MKHVLVAYDGSAPASRTLAHAADLARPGDRMTVVNVMAEPGVGARIAPPTEQRNRQWHLLDEAVRFLAGHDIEADRLAPVGDPAAEILAAAKDVGADVIVVADDRGRRVHGSVCDRIVHGAECDVLVVHAGPAR